MPHVQHIANHKQHLDLRWQIIRLVREFFWSENFTEVETPLILRLPGQEPYLSPMKLQMHNEKGESFPGYLHTSPEYTLKKMLGAGYEKIFSLGKVFRDNESFGGTHNPEFTMIEWYRANTNFYKIMDDCEKLFKYLSEKLETRNLKLASETTTNNFQFPISNFKRIHMRDLWKKYAGVNLDEYLTRDSMWMLCAQKRYKPAPTESYEDLFFRIFLNEIEPHLGIDHPVIVHHYPLPMAALAKKSDTNHGYAERFELYAGGNELANAFSELTDPQEQLLRLQKEQEERRALGKDVYDIDMEFIEALRTMPPSAGIALGIDRLVQLFASCQNINDVIPLPASELFKA